MSGRFVTILPFLYGGVATHLKLALYVVQRRLVYRRGGLLGSGFYFLIRGFVTRYAYVFRDPLYRVIR